MNEVQKSMASENKSMGDDKGMGRGWMTIRVWRSG